MNRLLGRREKSFPLPTSLPKNVVVTGAAGSLGLPLCGRLKKLGHRVFPLDLGLPNGDVLQPATVRDAIWAHSPCVVYHLAANKHAPIGELFPYDVAHLNIQSTQNVVAGAADVGARVIFASTCKAADPQTAYGASKLVGERIVLNAGQTVARLYNVIQTAGNVFRLWEEQRRKGKPLAYVPDAQRYFIDVNEALGFLLHCADLKPGRYAPDPGEPALMRDVVARFAEPGEELVEIPPRRGDRLVEPLHASSETARLVGGVLCITSPHDADYQPGEMAA